MKENKMIYLITLSPKSHRTSEENLGIEYLKAALTKNGYRVQIIDAWLNEYSVEEVYHLLLPKLKEILFVGISTYMSNTAPTIELIKKLKNIAPSIKIVCGGFGPTFYPADYLKEGSDYIIRGEGEDAICELADCILNNNEPLDVANIGLIYDGKMILNPVRSLNDNLDSFPFPSRDCMDVVLEKKSTVNMVTARGCSGNCEFCSVISFFRLSDGKIWRTRSIRNIVDEIEMLYKQGITHIKIVDDSFIDGTRDEKWCEEFANEIEQRQIKVNLRGQIRADKVTDSILKNLKRAGFFSFACGIENGSQSALTRMNKKATLEDNKRALELFKKNGYLVQMGYILFDKNTTLEELIENYHFMRKYDFAITKGIFSEMFSAEGTRLNERLKENGELIESDFISNNNKYQIDSIQVKKVYDALKKWHKSHCEIYDMTIDPLTAPKAISKSSMLDFYRYAMFLKRIDLEIFKKILLIIKENLSLNLMDYVDEEIVKYASSYEKVKEQVRILYKKNDLQYHAETNPFI